MEVTRERDRLQVRLAQLVGPQACDLSDASDVLEHLGDLWAEANERDKRVIPGSLCTGLW